MSDHDRKVLDSLVADACEQQRQLGYLPEPDEVKGFIQPIVETLDRKNAEAKPLRAPVEKQADARPTPTKARDLNEVAKRKGVEGPFEIVRTEKSRGPRVARKRSPFELKMEKMLRRRIRLLLSKEDWHERLTRINPLHSLGVGGPEKRRIAGELLMQVIRDSERVFGPWWKEPPRAIWSSGNSFRGGDASK